MTAAVRLRVWLTRRALDHRLAAGADPTGTSALRPAGAVRAHLLLQRGAAREPSWEQVWDVTDALSDHAR